MRHRDRTEVRGFAQQIELGTLYATWATVGRKTRTTIVAATAVSLLMAAGCSRSKDGNIAVGDQGPSVVEQERYLRRLHIDLNGATPSDEAMKQGLERLAKDGNSAATRQAIAGELMATRLFAETWIGELENRAFEGDSIQSRYTFMCAVFRTLDCSNECEQDVQDQCAECECSDLPSYMAEREALSTTLDDFAGGATTSAIERRYASTDAFQFPLAPEGVADVLFESFLGRPVEEDEARNVAGMVQGPFLDGSPSGLLFHRHGADYNDLMDIVFGSEPYRDALVDNVFFRYLGRHATPSELRHFSATVDVAQPDARHIIEAVVSSKEYFQL